jgi:uncharacterized protein YndB with AHSA1/START domain
VEISRPPEEVFDYCSDHRHEPQWNPRMTHAEKLTPGPIGAGTRYAAEFVKGPPMVMECTEYERPATWTPTGNSRALAARGGWRVLPTADGAHLVMHTEMEPHGRLKLAAPLLRRRPASSASPCGVPRFQNALFCSTRAVSRPTSSDAQIGGSARVLLNVSLSLSVMLKIEVVSVRPPDRVMRPAARGHCRSPMTSCSAQPAAARRYITPDLARLRGRRVIYFTTDAYPGPVRAVAARALLRGCARTAPSPAGHRCR